MHDADDDRHLLPIYLERPKTRGDCFRMPRPCPWVSCRYHLALDIDGKKNLHENFPGLDVDEMPETCALDAAGRKERTLEDVAVLLSVTRERVRQIEQGAIARVHRLIARLEEPKCQAPVERRRSLPRNTRCTSSRSSAASISAAPYSRCSLAGLETTSFRATRCSVRSVGRQGSSYCRCSDGSRAETC